MDTNIYCEVGEMIDSFNRGHYKNMFTEKDKHTTHSKTHRHFAPAIHKGEDLTVTIDALAPNRDGLAHEHGFEIHVPHTEIGETIRVKITSVNKDTVYAYRIGEKQNKNIY